jgi:Leucine-rich repeat (LRR) protein
MGRGILINKLQKIEGLEAVPNLVELNLSYNMITRIENLDHLIKLRELNLAENNIRKIENVVRSSQTFEKAF